MSYTTYQSDGFAGTNGTALTAHTPDNANGGTHTDAWVVQVGTGFTISENKAVLSGTGAYTIETISATATDCRVSGIMSFGDVAVVARLNPTTKACYLGYANETASGLYYSDGSTFTQIGVAGPGCTTADEIAIVPAGGTVAMEKNGTTILGPYTDTTLASGQPGMLSNGGEAGFDLWTFQTGSATATPTQLAITTQPAGNQSGVAFPTQPVVEVRDAGGAVVTPDTSTVTVVLITVTGSGTLGGTTTKAAVSGSAAFTGLSVTGAGTFKLRFTDGSLALADSAVFAVGATQLAITTAPTTARSGHASTIVVTAKDANGVAVGNYTGIVTLTLNKLSGAGSVATMTGGTSSAAAVGGDSTLTPIATTTDNGLVPTSYTYTATASGLTSATTATITPTIEESIAVTIT